MKSLPTLLLDQRHWRTKPKPFPQQYQLPQSDLQQSYPGDASEVSRCLTPHYYQQGMGKGCLMADRTKRHYSQVIEQGSRQMGREW
ncbi:hypothetical protein MKW98_018108 [Papaver atlanticum]|uniref:Uncharacterized protein n=1 Tax=Papaver atlanticum TaxID=357466 RepID=A0AAD4S9V3_9MAGN|nr:hypothetical protein MKW98_018108 [Papaver atlanticum]